MVWSSRSMVNVAALMIFVSLSYETLQIFTTKKEGEKSDGVIQASIERRGGEVEREREYLETPSGTTNRS